MLDIHGIIQYNCGHANSETAKAWPFFNSIDPRRFPVLAIQEPMITERNHTYIPRNFQSTRPPKYGMKVLFMVHNKIPLVDWEVIRQTDTVEWLRIKLGGKWLNIVNAYCRPGANNRTRVHSWDEIDQCLLEIGSRDCLLVGDFNCHHPAWGGRGITRERSAAHLLEQLENRGLGLLNEKGVITWKRGQSESTIDLGFASSGVKARVMKFQPRSEWTTMEDHFPIEIQLTGAKPRWRQNHRFVIKDAPWEAIAEQVERTEWDQGDGEGMLERLQTAIGSALERFCKRARPSDWARPEWSEKAAEFLAGARRARRAFHASGDPVDEENWKRNRNALDREMRRNARTRWRKFIEGITQDADGKNKHKGLWKMSKWSCKEAGRTGPPIIPPLRLKEGDPLESTNSGKADILASKFFPQSGRADLSDITDNNEFQRFQLEEDVSEGEVLEILSKLPSGKAPGPDMIPNEALKHLKKKIAPGIAKAITWIFRNGSIPECFKESITVVLPKDRKKDYSLPSSYRPIALENTIAKIVEKIIAEKIMLEAEKRELIPWNQMGARKQRSTLSALELLTGSIQTAWKAKKAVVSVLGLDLAGAFDNVSHGRLLWVLRRMGYPEWMVVMVQSFLTARKTKIAFSDYESDWFYTETGIPQGSTLSPALFIIFIADLLEQFKEVSGDVLGFGFVDDTTLITWGDSARSNCQRLTIAHDKCVEWARRFGAKFAPDKYQIIHFTRKKKVTEDLKSTITIQEHAAELVSSLRVLGVWLDPTLSWADHISKAVTKGISAFESMARITTSVWGPSVRKSRLIYTAVVRPVMLYGSQVWSTRPGNEIACTNKLAPLGTVQNKCLRRILGAYKRTPVPAIERESEIPPLDLHIKSQTTQWAFFTRDAPVTREIDEALNQVWRAAARRRIPTRGRRPRPAGPRPATDLHDIRRTAVTIKNASTRKMNMEEGNQPQRTAGGRPRPPRTLQYRSSSTEIDAYFADLWRQRWQSEASKRRNHRARVWHSPWDLRPLTLYESLAKHEATALFLLRTEVMGLNAWLANVIPGQSASCGCGAQRQTLSHLLTFCPNTTEARLSLIERTGSTDLRAMLDNPERAQAAARWLLETGVLGQFRVAMEVEEETVEKWEAFQGLQDVLV
jgi:hypothetical protein